MSRMRASEAASLRRSDCAAMRPDCPASSRFAAAAERFLDAGLTPAVHELIHEAVGHVHKVLRVEHAVGGGA